MAALDAGLSLGLVVAYLFAGPVLRAVGPQPVYRIGAIGAAGATLVLLPLLRLRHERVGAGGEEEPLVEATLAVEEALLPPAV